MARFIRTKKHWHQRFNRPMETHELSRTSLEQHFLMELCNEWVQRSRDRQSLPNLHLNGWTYWCSWSHYRIEIPKQQLQIITLSHSGFEMSTTHCDVCFVAAGLNLFAAADWSSVFPRLRIVLISLSTSAHGNRCWLPSSKSPQKAYGDRLSRRGCFGHRRLLGDQVHGGG